MAGTAKSIQNEMDLIEDPATGQLTLHRARAPQRPGQLPDGWKANEAMLTRLARHRVNA
jgi:hypothetical protein